ncbi:transcriptional regulator, partial [Candidatus Poribacteria bacterium]|nr:transcriptional regulator [Candidatus Poribacteria bacterium]
QLVDQAVDFVLSKINLWVGTRAESVQAPVAYEIPKEVVTEAIVNAVAHRDYTSNASVQVMLFTDRVEVLNPGKLPPTLTLDQLRGAHPSIPNNPLLAEPLYLTQYIERMGTGTLDMIRRCRDAGLPEPEFNDSGGFKTTIWRAKPAELPESLPESLPGGLKSKVLFLLVYGPMSRTELSKRLGQKKPTGQLYNVVKDLLNDQMLEYTLPETPRSRQQQYRLTEKGRIELLNLRSRDAV